MWFILMSLLIACNDKDDLDIGFVEDVGDTEDSDTEDTDTEDTDTEDTDTEDTDTEDTDSEEDIDSAFPDLVEDFRDRLDNASSMPIISDEDPENTTPTILMMVGFGPMLEIQMTVDAYNQQIASLEDACNNGDTTACDELALIQATPFCPEVQGEFPAEGLPTEDITIIGNGCTNDMGTTYEGSFIYGPEGLDYNDYIVRTTVDACSGAQSTNHYNGGVYLGLGFTGLDNETLMFIQSETTNEEDCNVEIGEFAFHSVMSMESLPDELQLINGQADILIAIAGVDYTYHLETVDQVNGPTCESEPLSGINSISNASDEIVFTYDGETDCDQEATQMVSINGGEPYEVAGASCSTTNSKGTLGWMIGVLGMLLVRRRTQR
jgi:hypothetical protein